MRYQIGCSTRRITVLQCHWTLTRWTLQWKDSFGKNMNNGHFSRETLAQTPVRTPEAQVQMTNLLHFLPRLASIFSEVDCVLHHRHSLHRTHPFHITGGSL